MCDRYRKCKESRAILFTIRGMILIDSVGVFLNAIITLIFPRIATALT